MTYQPFVATVALLAALLLPAKTFAQEAPSDGSTDEIVVTAIKGQWSLEGKRIRAAQAAFFAGRDRYAPQASMLFQVTPRGGRSTEGLRLTLRNKDEAIDVPLDAKLRFELPPLRSDGWQLTANRTPAEMSARLWILSPGTDETDRRVGDLRLYCRVGSALQEKPFDFTLVERGMFAALGGCASTRMGVFTSASKPLSAASVTRPDGITHTLAVLRGTQYRMPLADKDVPDEAHVHLRYR